MSRNSAQILLHYASHAMHARWFLDSQPKSQTEIGSG